MVQNDRRLVERMNDLKQITDCILFPLIVDLLDATQEHKSTESLLIKVCHYGAL